MDVACQGTGCLDPIPEFGPSGWKQPDHLCRPARPVFPDGRSLTLDREEQDFKPIGELVDNYVCKLDEKPRYIPTGLSVLDKYLHLSPGNLFIIGGRPSAGKTALSLQMACEQARKGYRVCYFSLEPTLTP